MKMTFRSFLSLGAVAIALVASTPAFAATDTRFAPTSGGGVATLDPLTLTTGVAMNYPSSTATIDTSFYTAMSCEYANDAGASRLIIPKCYAERAGTNVTFIYPTMTVATAAQGRYVFDPALTAATADTGVTDSPNRPCRFVRLTAAAAASTGRISCTMWR